MTYELFVSLRYLRAKRKQTFISVISFISIAGVTLGVAALIVVLASIAVMSFTNLAERGVAITGAIPSGLPTPQIPALFDPSLVRLLLPLAFSVFMLSYVEGMSMARTFADKHHYKIDADQELLALGMSNLGVGVFQGFPIGGSMSRSAVGDKSGAQSPLAGGVAAMSIAVVLLFLTGLFTNLPETILAAVVIVAVKGLFKTKALAHLSHVNRIEFWIALVVLFCVLLFGMLEGVLIGVIVSLLLLVYRRDHPPRRAPVGRAYPQERPGVPGRPAQRGMPRKDWCLTSGPRCSGTCCGWISPGSSGPGAGRSSPG